MTNLLNKQVIKIFDFLLPRFCLVCEDALSSPEKIVCNKCIDSLELTTQKQLEIEYNRKFLSESIISDFISCYSFKEESSIQKLLHKLKYEQNYHIGEYLGTLVAKKHYDKIKNWNIDYIVPIPLHSLKKNERGFNQAEEIAKGFSKVMNITLLKNSIVRKRYTQSQTKLNHSERKLNIAGAFSVKNKKLINNKNILLIDDVITTGATIRECGIVLLKNGASKIYSASVAIAS